MRSAWLSDRISSATPAQTASSSWSDVDDSDIEGNDFHDIAANAIEIDALATPNPPPELQSENVAIWNNGFRHAGSVYSNGGAVLAHCVKGLIVEHNDISDMPYSGMQVGDQPGGYKPVGMHRQPHSVQ